MKKINRGIVAMMVASASFAMMSVMVKFSGKSIPLAQQLFFRNFVMIFLAMFLMRRNKISYRVEKGSRIDLALRCLFGFLSMVMIFYANNHLDLADVLVLQKLNPFFVSLLAAWFLSERITREKVIPLIIAFVGVVILVGPKGSFDLFPSMMALLSALLGAVAYVLLRKMAGHVEGEKVIFYFSAFSFLATLVPMALVWKTPTLGEGILLLLIGVFAGIGQYFLTYAYQHAPASEVSLFDYTGVILSPILGWLFFREVLSLNTLIGMIFIVGGGFLSHDLNRKKERRNNALSSENKGDGL